MKIQEAKQGSFRTVSGRLALSGTERWEKGNILEKQLQREGGTLSRLERKALDFDRVIPPRLRRKFLRMAPGRQERLLKRALRNRAVRAYQAQAAEEVHPIFPDVKKVSEDRHSQFQNHGISGKILKKKGNGRQEDGREKKTISAAGQKAFPLKSSGEADVKRMKMAARASRSIGKSLRLQLENFRKQAQPVSGEKADENGEPLFHAGSQAASSRMSGLKAAASVLTAFLYSLIWPVLLIVGAVMLAVMLAITAVSALIPMFGSVAGAANGVYGWLDIHTVIPYYAQADYNYPFNGKTIATSGCGITSFAMAVSGLTGKEIRPTDIADLANADARYNTVTSHGAIEALAEHFGLGEIEEMGGPNRNCCGKQTFSKEYLMKMVSSYHPVILSLTGGYYNPSGGGHYILVCGAGENGAYVFDPGSRAKYQESITNDGSDWDTVFAGAKHIWILPPVTRVLSGATNAEKIYHGLVEAGLSEEAACGVIGNLFQETNHGGEDIKTDTEEPTYSNGTGGGVGILQWSGGRKIQFLTYAESRGQPWPETSLEVQLEFFLQELNSGEQWLWPGYGSDYGNDCHISYEEWKSCGDLSLATRAFCANFERPYYYQADIDYRIQMAEWAYQTFAK